MTPDLLDSIRAQLLSSERRDDATINHIIHQTRAQYGGETVYVRVREQRPPTRQYLLRKQRREQR